MSDLVQQFRETAHAISQYEPENSALGAMLAEAADRIEELEREMARRDENENRNCINWGPCSRHDTRMEQH